MHTNAAAQLEKIVLNAGIGRMSAQPHFGDKLLPAVIEEFALIAGQKPAPRPARQSIAGFKMREGTIVGLKATLRGHRMAAFFEKLVAIVLPRLRDFRGIDPDSIDRSGTLTIGLKDHTVFSEVSPDVARSSFGMEITLVPRRVKSRDQAIELYRKLGVPLKK